MKEWSKRLNETKMINLKGGDAQQGEDYFVQSVGSVSDGAPATRKVRTTARKASNGTIRTNRPASQSFLFPATNVLQGTAYHGTPSMIGRSLSTLFTLRVGKEKIYKLR